MALHADQHTVALCNQVLQAAKALAFAVLPGRRNGPIGPFITAARGVPGPKPEDVQKAADKLSEARRVFANHLRELQGRSPVLCTPCLGRAELPSVARKGSRRRPFAPLSAHLRAASRALRVTA